MSLLMCVTDKISLSARVPNKRKSSMLVHAEQDEPNKNEGLALLGGSPLKAGALRPGHRARRPARMGSSRDTSISAAGRAQPNMRTRVSRRREEEKERIVQSPGGSRVRRETARGACRVERCTVWPPDGSA
jgi:hypothetical protein